MKERIRKRLPVEKCVHSPFNTRKTRDPEVIERLAERIKRIGYEPTRAIWVYERQGRYEVFAGGYRLEAARRAGLSTIPAVIYRGYSEEEISRLSDVDNENDEYHTPVSPVDVWAEYYRLWKEEGWTQEKIARAKGVDQSFVARRIKLHLLPEGIKQFMSQGFLTEGHFAEILGICVDSYLSGWLTTEQTQKEIIEKAAKEKWSVKTLRDEVKKWKEFIALAQREYEGLDEKVTLYEITGEEAKPFDFFPKEHFVSLLAKYKARSIGKVREAASEVREYIAENLALYEEFVKRKSEEAARKAIIDKRRREVQQRFLNADIRKVVKDAPGPIRLVLTDPPYGIGFKSHHRKEDEYSAMVGDDPEVFSLIREVMEALIPKMHEDAHVLMFCHWRNEPRLRETLGDLLELKGVLIWVKENFTFGDLYGSFAPKYEMILHFVKGRPDISPRIPDVLEFARPKEQFHPTQKPVPLLCELIRVTTTEGQLVVDPFAGVASTLVAAVKMKRDFWGCEIDEGYWDIGLRRIWKECGLWPTS